MNLFHRRKCFFLTGIFIIGFVVMSLSAKQKCSDIVIKYESLRHSFLRGETPDIVISATNNSPNEISAFAISISIDEWISQKLKVKSLAAGRSVKRVFSIDTNKLKSDTYNLNCSITADANCLAEKDFELTVARRWNSNRMKVWLWPHFKFGDKVYKLDKEAKKQLKWYGDKGFNAFNPGGGVRDAHNYKGAMTDGMYELYDYALTQGLDMGFALHNGYFMENEIDSNDALFKPKRKWKPFKNFTNPFHKKIAKKQQEHNEKIMQQLSGFPNVNLCYLESEMEQCLLSELPLAKKMYPYDFGATVKHKFLSNGVIPDNDEKYVKHLFKYNWADGLAYTNLRTSNLVHKYRQDITVFTDPLRYTNVYGRFKGLDAGSTWIYTNPDPKYILYVESLIANGKPFNRGAIQTITLLNYPGTLAGKDDGWTIMGPDRIKETSWLTLSRNPEMMSYYVSSGCDPFDPGYPKDVIGVSVEERQANFYPYCYYPETFQALKSFNEKVVKPFGAMINKLERKERKVAVLFSEASGVYPDSPKLQGHYPPYQIYNFYAVLSMAHIPADIVFEKTILDYGLDKYDVLVMPKCDTLPESVYKKIKEFEKRGGTLVSDQYLRAEFDNVKKFEFDFTYRTKVSANAIKEGEDFATMNDIASERSSKLKDVNGVTAKADQQIMEKYAKQLRSGMDEYIDRFVDSPSETVLFNTLEKDGAYYIFVVNDKRTYNDRFENGKAMLAKSVTQTAEVRLDSSVGNHVYIYDALKGEKIQYNKDKGKYSFKVKLGEIGGTILAVLPRAVSNIEINAPENINKSGETYPIEVLVKDKSGLLACGVNPLKVTITDPEGNISEFSDYYAAESGFLKLPFVPAENDIEGKWKVEVENLMTKQTKVADFNVK